jgi:aarF domain-containing kinase
VAVITADYVQCMALDARQEVSEYERLGKELSDLQTKQEQQTIEMWKFKDSDSTRAASLEKAIADTRTLIDQVAAKMSTIRSASASAKSGNGDEVLSPFEAVHKRSATRLRIMCSRNKGVYVKLGQHVAMLDHIVPQAYQDELCKLLADNPHSSFESVRRVIKSELGRYPEEIWERFEPTAIASASLAQVHIAYDKAGNKYAVKVQHEDLRNGAHGDMLAITFLIHLLSSMFKDFNYDWLAREMNKNLPLELDFENEVKNMKKCALLLRDLVQAGDVVVPTPDESLASSRVLTMGFEQGSYVTDIAAINRMGLDPAHVARLISVAFCEQMYRHGFVHCDPHDANLLVRPHKTKKGQPCLVLLDHGLYRELTPEFRKNYCRLWQALVCSDEDGIKEYCTRLNAGQMFTLLASMLLMRPWDDITSKDISRLKNNPSAGEAEMLKGYAKKYFKEIIQLLGDVPSELLLLLKTNDCLRHLDRKLGAPINTAVVVADITSDVIRREDLAVVAAKRDMGSTLKIWSTWFAMRLRVWFLTGMSVFVNSKPSIDNGRETHTQTETPIQKSI